jgi:hypothetical protein
MFTDVSGKPIGSIVKGKAVHKYRASLCLGMRVVHIVREVQYGFSKHRVKKYCIYYKTARPFTAQGLIHMVHKSKCSFLQDCSLYQFYANSQSRSLLAQSIKLLSQILEQCFSTGRRSGTGPREVLLEFVILVF